MVWIACAFLIASVISAMAAVIIFAINLQKRSDPMKKVSIVLTAIFVILLIPGMMLWPKGAEYQYTDEEYAKIATRHAVEANLEASAAPKWDDYDQWDVIQAGDTFEVEAYIGLADSNGVYLKYKVESLVHKDSANGTWSVDSLLVGGKTII